MTRIFAALGLAAVTLSSVSANAEVRAFRADYTVTLLGLPVARASFDSSFEGSRFRIEGSFSSSGIARLFDDTNATTRVEGSISAGKVRPSAFNADYVSGRKKGTTEIRFAGGTVKSAINRPDKKRDPKNWVAVSASHLKSALDPLSSSLVVATKPSEVCNRTIRFFDGELRADLRLETAGYPDGERITCLVRFAPVAGYRPGRKQIEYLKNRSRITITFAPLPDTGLYTPVDASVSTQIGTLRIQATRIEAR